MSCKCNLHGPNNNLSMLVTAWPQCCSLAICSCHAEHAHTPFHRCHLHRRVLCLGTVLLPAGQNQVQPDPHGHQGAPSHKPLHDCKLQGPGPGAGACIATRFAALVSVLEHWASHVRPVRPGENLHCYYRPGHGVCFSRAQARCRRHSAWLREACEGCIWTATACCTHQDP